MVNRMPEGTTGGADPAPTVFAIASRHRESDVVTSFVLRPADGSRLPPFIAGQHLTLFAELPGRGRHKRNYTVSAAPNGESYRISVKREAAGTVSRWLHDEASVGTKVGVGAPAGDFVLPVDSARPVVLVSAGVGLTPMVAMLEEVARSHAPRRIHFVHGSRDGGAHAFAGEVRALAKQADAQVTVFYSQPRSQDVAGRDHDVAGRVTVDWLAGHTPLDEAEYFLCGPLPFLRDMASGLAARGVPRERLHCEFFGAVDDLFEPDAAAAGPSATSAAATVDARHARASAGFTREELGAALLDSAADAVVASDAAGDIVLWNAGAERIFGFTEDEALGRSLDIIIPEPFRARHWEGYRETVASGVSRYGAGDMLAVPGLRKDGARISLEFTIVLVKDAAGTVSGMVASLRDVTARFEEMKALRKAVRERTDA
ncbi:PAS domain S-box protein [Ancylobacter crimeensis]|uniref:PAS domain S-box protein n=1 Tax=Ancylobacter crimeensis TaxID=2579147 RepID=UPI0031BA326C